MLSEILWKGGVAFSRYILANLALYIYICIFIIIILNLFNVLLNLDSLQSLFNDTSTFCPINVSHIQACLAALRLFLWSAVLNSCLQQITTHVECCSVHKQLQPLGSILKSSHDLRGYKYSFSQQNLPAHCALPVPFQRLPGPEQLRVLLSSPGCH